jgi:class 3 adenylate cyclase
MPSDVYEEFLKYAPAYAQQEARQAIEKIVDLQKQGVIRSGLYYVVLVDLVGSTKFAAAHGNEAAADRIRTFISASFNALNEIKVRNTGLFVKEIGDAVLFVFQHFPDVLRWRAQFARWVALPSYDAEPIVLRTCVHIGEVYLEGVNPLSLAVSQTFKMEKTVPGGAIALTQPAYSVAWPTLARAYHAFAHLGDVDLDGFQDRVGVYILNDVLPDELDRIASETL